MSNLKSYKLKSLIVFIPTLFMVSNIHKQQKSIYIEKIFLSKPIVVDRLPPTESLFTTRQNFLKEEVIQPSSELNYIEINTDILKEFLSKRNSILTDEPYFSTIIDVSNQLNINPLLMFAILGQEQGFVPRSNVHAYKIANNPFNVFGSWRKYNTNIKDSSEIAARTLINLSLDKPQDEDIIKWINTRGGRGGYAEDENWWIGVKSIFEKLKNETIN